MAINRLVHRAPSTRARRISVTTVVVAIVAGVSMACAGSSIAAPAAPMYGLTLDRVDNLTKTMDAISSVGRRTTTRVVFDENVKPGAYRDAVTRLAPKTTVMGEILDSEYVHTVSTAAYVQRTRDYVAALGSKVSIWEVGNEVNGEWLGDARTVSAKVSGAYDVVNAAGDKTALTLYFNPNSYEKPANEMWTWTAANIPARMRTGLDYVLLSWYEFDNGNQRFTTAQWTATFRRLKTLFPNAKVGFGEIGWSKTLPVPTKQDMMSRFYRMAAPIRAEVPDFVGGYFWWNWYQDCVANGAPLLSTFRQVVTSY
jgi:hypothetical protein